MPLDDFILDVDHLDSGAVDNYLRPLRLRSHMASVTNQGGGGYFREAYTRGDTAPDLRAQCMDGAGQPVNFTVVPQSLTVRIANRIAGTATWVDPATGLWQYQFTGLDLDTTGEFPFELNVVLQSGATMTFPSQEQDRPVLVVRADLAVPA